VPVNSRYRFRFARDGGGDDHGHGNGARKPAEGRRSRRSLRRARPARFAPAAVAVMALFATGAMPAEAVSAKADPERLAKKLAKAVSADKAHRHLRALQRVADTNGGNRAAGLPGHEASARYVTDRLTAAGYQVTYQPFTFTDYDVHAESAKVTAPGEWTLHPYVTRFSPSTPEGGLTGEVAVVPAGADLTPGCEAADYAGADFTGRIALIKAGGCTNTIKQKTAAEAGAVAALVDTNNPARDMNVRSRLTAADAKIPTATLSLAEGERLAEEASAGTVSMHLELRGQARESSTFNVIAETPTGRADNVVIAGGHLDSVTEGAGSNDNGSSTSMLLETALRLAPHWGELRNKVRFAWWGAEEHGLLGATYYVSQLNPEQRLDVALYLNFDMIGSPNFARMVYDGDGSDPGSPAPGPYGSAQIEKVFLDFFAGREQPTVARVFDGRSDYGPFIAAGIPAGGATSGSNLIKTPEWQQLFGGVAGQPTDWCYHQPCDNLGNVNREIYDQLGDSIAWTVGRFGIDTADVGGEGTQAAAVRAARTPAAGRHIPFVPAPEHED
jgi:Zn-dependent M28 family amino/carboxypeptidase